MVILDDREANFRKIETFEGLIGMDFLSKYQIYMSPTQNELRFIPNETPVAVSNFWPRIFLKENPFQRDDRALHFMDIRIGGRKVAAMLDTGAEFSVMNWPAASYSQIKHLRKKLREEWLLQGAVGIFRPTTKIRLEGIRGGQIFWTKKEFVVLDFESLDILGIENQPFIIAGMNLFANEALFIDFERNFLSLVPDRSNQEAISE